MRIYQINWNEYYYVDDNGDGFNGFYKSTVITYIYAIQYDWSQKEVESAKRQYEN